jgi:TolB-like protein
MKKTYILLVALAAFVMVGCGPTNPGVSPWAKEKKVYGFSFIDGEVVEAFDDKVIVRIDDKDVVVGDSYEDKLTNKIIKNSLFVNGLKTKVNKENAVVSDVRGQQITFDIKDALFAKGQDVKIYLPKKTIAVMDFSLTGMESSTMEKLAMDDMITKLVQSGQYIVVEREKLDSILKEQELADSGLLDESSASKVGKLAAADIILTGSFAKIGASWKVNLRLVDVETGIIISAINDKIDADEFRPKQHKDSSNLTEDFEDESLAIGWMNNVFNKRGSKSKGMIDKTTGANGTTSSYKIDYLFKKEESATGLVNKRQRDISKYRGIKFYAKASSYTTIAVNVHDQNYDDAEVNRWNSLVSVGSSWKEYKVSFDRLSLAKNFARKNPGGDGTFDRDNIESIVFGLSGKGNVQNKEVSLWIDEISFY